MYMLIGLCYFYCAMCTVAVDILASVWRQKPRDGGLNEWTFHVPSRLDAFRTKYDCVQEQLETLAALDDLLAGMAILCSQIFHMQ